MTEASIETVSLEQRELAQRLRAYRRAVQPKLSGEKLAETCGWSQSKVSKIEVCRTIPQITDVKAWAAATGVEGDDLRELLDLADRALTKVTEYRKGKPRNRAARQAQIAALEAQASAIWIYQPNIIPGLLQTAEYFRRLLAVAARPRPPAEISAAVEARMQRQSILYQGDKQLRFLIGEGALRWRPGPPPVLLGQLDRLMSLIDLPSLEIAVIPFATKAAAVPTQGFQLTGDPTRDDDFSVIVEGIFGGDERREQADLELCLGQFEALRNGAFVGADARSLIASIMHELQPRSQKSLDARDRDL